eukprot:1140597-Pelagomonas_calceolata.AAC.2
MVKIGGPQITLLTSNHAKIALSSTLGPIFTPNCDFKSLKTTQFGAIGGPEWRHGGQNVGFMPRLIWQMSPS